MLTELALTPHALQPCGVDPNGWTRQINALNQRLLHYGKLCPLIFSNLNDGHSTNAWVTTIVNGFAATKPSQHRAARDLFDRIQKEDLLVSRPSQNLVQSPTKEDNWVNEAIRPAPGHPVDQIVTSWQGANTCRKIFTQVVGLNELDRADFWTHIVFAATPKMNIRQQIQTLRPVWLHSQLLATVLPYGLDSEADWFIELAKCLFSKPAGYPTPQLELHVSSQKEDNEADMKSQGDKYWRIREFIQHATPKLPPGTEFNLYVRFGRTQRHRFIARRLFAGEPANVGTATPAVRIRWGVALEHVASPNDAPDQSPATFTLLPKHQADAQFRLECESEAVRLVGPILIRC